MALTVTVIPNLVAIDGETPFNAATLNALARPTVLVTGTVGGSTSVSVDNITIDQGGGGSSLQVKDLGVTEGKLGALSVTAAKLAPDAVETAKVKDEAITAPKLDEGALSRFYGAGTYSAGTYQVDLTPNATVFTTGMMVIFKASASNAAGACSVQLDALAAKALKRGGKDPLADSIPANGWIACVYDGTNFEITGQADVQYESAELAIATGKALDAAHGLGARPRRIWAVLRCTTGEAGYTAGDEINADQAMAQITGTPNVYVSAVTPGASATNVFALIQVRDGIYVQNKGTGLISLITVGNWKLVVRAEL